MDDLQQTRSEMQSIEQQLQPYENPDFYSEVGKAAKSAWDPVAQSAAQSVERKMSEFLPRYMQIGYGKYEGGTDAASLDPSMKLQMMSSELGKLGGSLAYSQQLGEHLVGKANEMAQNAIQAAQLGQQALAQKYERASQRYQLAFQAEEARKQREAQERAARMSRAGSGGGSASGTIQQMLAALSGGNSEQVPDYVRQALQTGQSQNLYNAMKNWEQQSGGYNPNMHEKFWAQWRDWNYFPGAGNYSQDWLDNPENFRTDPGSGKRLYRN